MICKKCGKEFEGNFCPSCGTKFDAEDSERTPKNYTESKGEGTTRKKSKKKTIIISSIAATVLSILTVFLLCLFNVINIPVLSSWFNYELEEITTEQETEMVTPEKEIVADKIVFNYENTVYVPNPENVVFDSDANISYVNNMIIIVFVEEATEKDIGDVISSISGKIVGNINSINQYQIEIDAHSLSELNSIVKKVQENDCVLFAHCDRAYKNIESSFYPNDPWDNDVDREDWLDSDVDGSNWWIEAIEAPAAWNYNDFFSNIKIGIVDNGFDTGHEDLNITFPENFRLLNNKADHGTHVAGIIGAISNNEKGISGIVWKNELICFDWQPTKWQEWTTGWETDTMIYAGLIFTVESGAKVVNFSLGMAGDFPNGNIYTQDVIDEQGRTSSGYLAVLLKKYDFIVVQAAGNGGVDAQNAGLFASISDSNCVTWGTGRASIQGIMNRLLIVAAIERSADGYTVSSFSDGGSQVNISAPGGNASGNNNEDIYSTVTGGWHGKYRSMPGTSMAAPIVTSVASLVWSINNNFTGDEVVDIVCSNTVLVAQDNPISTQTQGDFPIVNAKLAVEEAIRRTNPKDILDGLYLAYFSFDNTLEDNVNVKRIYGNGDYSFKNGVNGNCLYLDGDGDYLDLGKDYQLPQNFTFNVWVKSESEDRSDAAIFAKYETNHYGPYDFYLSYNRPAFWVSDGKGGNEEYISKTTLSSDKWYMITYVKNESVLKIYVNGKLDLSVECDKITTNDDRVTIGRQSLMFSPYSHLQYKGYIDELKIFDKALNEKEICDLFEKDDNTTLPNSKKSIPSDAFEYNGHHYKIYVDACSSWEEAKEYCENLGGHLAVISSKEENDALFSYIISSGNKNAYFGYSDNQEEGNWYWNGDNSSYTNWHKSEPNSERSNEDFAMFYWKYSDGTWNDGNFGQGTVSDDRNFICEWD